MQEQAAPRPSHQRGAGDDDRDGHPHGALRDGAAVDLDVRVAAGLGDDRQEHHGDGGDLDAAGRRRRAAAGEHQGIGEQHGGGIHVVLVHQVEAARAGHDRGEQRVR